MIGFALIEKMPITIRLAIINKWNIKFVVEYQYMCVDLCYRALAEPSPVMTRVRAQCFHALDAFVRLIQLLLRHSGDNSSQHTKINLLNKVIQLDI